MALQFNRNFSKRAYKEVNKGYFGRVDCHIQLAIGRLPIIVALFHYYLDYNSDYS